MVHQIHIAVLDVDIPARKLYEARGLCSAHFRTILRETASRLNETFFSEREQLEVKITPYDIRGGHYPDLYKLRGHADENNTAVQNPVDAILITGGSPGVYEMERSPWMQELQRFIKTVFNEYPEVRILGTCFGHQLISHALVRNVNDTVRDVWVEKCPLGREVGIYTVQLEKPFTQAFPAALGDLPGGQLRIQMFHGDRVMAVEKGTAVTLADSPPVSLPAPWVNIGSTPICPIQGLYHPGRVLSVQGHYEMDAFGMTKMCFESAPVMGWKESKLALFLEQVGDDLEEGADDSKAFASAVVCFLAGVEE
jgi:GMP synthase-like glutamine amidotransferase